MWVIFQYLPKGTFGKLKKEENFISIPHLTTDREMKKEKEKRKQSYFTFAFVISIAFSISRRKTASDPQLWSDGIQ